MNPDTQEASELGGRSDAPMTSECVYQCTCVCWGTVHTCDAFSGAALEIELRTLHMLGKSPTSMLLDL